MSENEQKPTNLRKRPAKPEIPDSAKVSKKSDGANPAWFLPVTLTLMILGLIWIMVYYISQTVYPLGSGSPINLGAGNIVIGFGLMMVGFGFLTRWK
jgi:hypothetical protein